MAANIIAPGPGVMVIKVTGEASTAAGGIGAVANPEGRSLLITRTSWHIETPSTGAANVNIGVGDADADNTDIINALAANGAIAGKVYNGQARQNTAKTEITAPAVWTDAKYITFKGSGSTADLVAYLYVEYIPLS